MKHPATILALLTLITQTATALTQEQLQQHLNLIQLPPGFQIHLYAHGIQGARSMTRGDQGTIFVGTRTDKVYALTDQNQDHKIDQIHTIINGGNHPDGTPIRMPNGVAYKDGALYVAAISHILKFDNIENNLQNPPQPAIITSDYPTDIHHGWKYIAFGPDNKLYVPVGAPCNVCQRPEPIYATITTINPDGTNRQIIAHGVRNTVGFDWHPQTQELWFTDNGADNMGNDYPADELNRLTQPGQHFGYPHCHQGDGLDPRFGTGHTCGEFTPPAINLGPHVAALGMRFYTGQMFPQQYQNQILIAEHGSWNRDRKIGYRITLVRLQNNQPISYEDFATGWLQGQQDWGRPVDLLILPDGSLLISDDKAHAIYRITYTNPN